MLQKVCEEVHNYFVCDRLPERYTIADGTLSPAPALSNGQRFLVVGSALNDGVYTWHPYGINTDDDDAGATLFDEVFTGTVCSLAIPRAFLDLVARIGAWDAKYAEAAASPYQSESFGGYSYTKANGADGTQGGGATWQAQFRRELDRWRKVSF